jgi:hypothetical protein
MNLILFVEERYTFYNKYSTAVDFSFFRLLDPARQTVARVYCSSPDFEVGVAMHVLSGSSTKFSAQRP